MWVANRYKQKPYYFLWNRKPRKVSDDDYVNELLRNRGDSELLYEGWHGYVPIPKRFQHLFDDIEEPVEVELIRDDSDDPMFYGQKILDDKGNENVYIHHKLTYSYYPIDTTGKKNPIRYVSYGEKPKGEYTDLSVGVSTCSDRIRPKDFKWTVDDGYIPLTIKIKE